MSRPQIVNLTLEDLGTDALPVEKYIDALEAERDRWQKQALEWGAECESVSAMLQAAGEDAAEIKQEHAALVAHVERLDAGVDQLLRASCEDEADEAMAAINDARADEPTHSLARRDAKVKAEAATEMSLRRPPGSVQRSWMQEVANEYRQQAEGGGDAEATDE